MDLVFESSTLFLNDDASIKALDAAFTTFVLQRGQISSMAQLLEFLDTVAGAVDIPRNTITAAHLQLCSHIWSEASPRPITRGECRECVAALKALAVVVFIEPETLEHIFSSLAHGGEYLPRDVLVAVLKTIAAFSFDDDLIGRIDDVFQDIEDETLTLASLADLCDAFVWLSSLLSDNSVCIIHAAQWEVDAAESPPAEKLPLVDAIAAAILSSRSTYAAMRLARSRDAAAAQTKHGTKSSVFYPQLLAATNGVGQPVGTLLAPVTVRAKDPKGALGVIAQQFAPQALVRRVADLRKTAAVHEARRQSVLRADIQHAVYEATELASLGVVKGSRPNILRPLDLEGVGERAGKRLHPHTLPPHVSMCEKLSQSLGITVSLPIDDSPRPAQDSDEAALAAALLRQRIRTQEKKMADSRRPRAKPAALVSSFFSASTMRNLGEPNFHLAMPKFRRPQQRLAVSASGVAMVCGKQRSPSRELTRGRPLSRPSSATLRHPEVSDLHHELRIVICDALDALESSGQRGMKTSV